MTGLLSLAGGEAAAAYSIANSCRFNDDDSAELERTFGAPTSTQVFTLAFWVKRGNLGTSQFIFASNTGSNDRYLASFGSDDLLAIHLVGSSIIKTDMEFRDPGAWYHVVIGYDGTEGTANDRPDIEVDGVAVAWSNSAGTPPATPDKINTAVAHAIGAAANANYSDLLLADVYFVDGQKLTASSFGETDSTTGQWVPIAYAGTYGNNGFYFDFADSGDLGDDESGNANDWTEVNLAANDQLVDTPTLNYPVWNYLDEHVFNGFTSDIALANGNLQINNGNGAGCKAAFKIPDGDWYMEITHDDKGVQKCGVIEASCDISVSGGTNIAGESCYNVNTGNKNEGTTATAHGDVFVDGDVLDIAVKKSGTSVRVWYGRNGTWQSGDPATDTTPAYDLTITEDCFFGVRSLGGTTQTTANFRQHAWADSIPSGYLPLNTDNMAAPSVKDPADFVGVAADTEANIEATVAALRSGWTNYVDLLKNRDTDEEWMWRFSHDSSNGHGVDTTSLYRAISSLSGADDWVGMTLRIGSAYGTAAGSQAHTVSTNTTVTHNLGNANCAIFLFPRGDGEVPYYHHKLTAGKLLFLTYNGAEATNTRIENVTANAFDIGPGSSTDTYDWLVLVEVEGLIALPDYDGNNVADGAFFNPGHKPLVTITKPIDASALVIYVFE